MRRLAALVLSLVVASAAIAATRPAHVRVSPRAGTATTIFKVGFTTPDRTGVSGGSARHDLVTGSVDGGGTKCVTGFSVRAPDARAGARVRVALRPTRLGGSWCTGTYEGQVEEIQTAVCPRGELCPTYVRLVRILGHFRFAVAGRDTQPPRFGGLDRAFACTPGPQRPGQTTPYTLSWHAASDARTPTHEIVYDIYYATSSDAEDFHKATWSTAPGATSFRTPGLPSHGQAYFVVRARDRAGNEDGNTVERQGMDPCL